MFINELSISRKHGVKHMNSLLQKRSGCMVSKGGRAVFWDMKGSSIFDFLGKGASVNSGSRS